MLKMTSSTDLLGRGGRGLQPHGRAGARGQHRASSAPVLQGASLGGRAAAGHSPKYVCRGLTGGHMSWVWELARGSSHWIYCMCT